MKILSALLLLLAAPLVQAEAQRTDHLSSQLVAEQTAAVPGQPLRLGLLLEHDPHWHTYWVNPGDSGIATKLDVVAPERVEVGTIDWPVPDRFDLAGIINYGYGDRALLPFTVQVPADFAGDTLRIEASGRWLICEIECIPGKASYVLELPLAASAEPDPRWQADFAWADARLPRAAEQISLAVSMEGERVLLDLSGALPPGIEHYTLFPRTPKLVANPAQPEWRESTAGWQVRWQQSEYFGGLSAGSEWVLRGPDEVLALTAGDAPAAAAPPPTVADATGAKEGATASLWLAMGLALLGGLILNLMPCVFPVLSIKAMGALESADDRAALRSHGLWYTAGVVLSFLAVAGLLLALRAAGEQIGWGFQLQSPGFVAGMALLLFAMGLSFSGVWEFTGRFTSAGQGLTEGHGARSAFFTGVLATVVASPCTAPFMGTALGVALAQPPLFALAVFAALGLGLALPMLLLGWVPALARALPRPGPWMDGLRQLLAFPLYLTCIWLLWVYGEQTSPLAMAWLLAGLVAVAFGLWLLQRRRSMVGGGWRLASAIAIVAALGLGLAAPFRDAPRAQADAAASGANEVFSHERLASLRAEGRPVLVNMTAAWCITCLANERVALSSDTVREALEQTGTVYLKGDWTLHDASITAYLESFDRNGVPLYVHYPANGGAPTVLPQLLTPEIVVTALRGG
ncbi:protein-disulfide reductase DsbD family protein [Pseudomarimonas salicorniae]|uniref:Thioredoxin family protein n=1 Tax=Pseudomarimonas salicorniae TaxID=2933270 RepID=A0ABT0GH31_9GAMM|nr:thioredoxin family protein [Lysobacter sp. CAU 1642]MCK7593519.1 thioredoxin family protein [Lysobacter sp. CAU 1642]